MKEHELKTWPKFFNAILSGKKKFEYRKNDRNYQVNDTLLLRETTDQDASEYTGRKLYVYITYIYETPDGWAILSIEPQDTCSRPID